MVKIGLQIKANFVNVSRLYPQDSDSFSWPLKIKCTSCGEENPNVHLISENEVIELSNSEVNFSCKCKCCSRENSLSILSSNKYKTRTPQQKLLNSYYEEEDENKFKTIISFDCRGLEITEFQFSDGWAVECGKKIFREVDLSDDWCEYNDIDNEPVEINNLEYKLIVLK